MKKSIELKSDRAAVQAQATQLVELAENEGREFTEAEQTTFDGYSAEISRLNGAIENAEKREKLLVDAARSAGVSANAISKNDQRDVSKYSFVKVSRSLMAGGSLDGLEREMNEEAQIEARANGFSIEGVGVPSVVFQGEKRDMTAGTGSQGGFMVQTDVSTSLIEALYPKMVLQQAGAQVLGNLTGNLDIPSTGGVTVGAKAETGTADETTPTIGRVQLTPKRITAFTDVSKQLLNQSSISVENMLRNDFMSALASQLENYAIEGGGSNEPTGILATAGIGDVAGGTNGLAATYANILALEKEVAIDNADIGSLHYITNPKVRAALKNLFIDSGSGRQVWDRDNTVNGYSAMATTNVPSDLTKGSGTDLSAIIFGNFNDLILANWGGLDVMVNPYTKSKDGIVEIVVNMFADAAVRRAQSFAAMKDAIA